MTGTLPSNSGQWHLTLNLLTPQGNHSLETGLVSVGSTRDQAALRYHPAMRRAPLAHRPRRYEVGSFTLDGARRVLWDDEGTQVEVPSQAFDALLYLVENPGRIVSREELLDALWPDSHVEDNTLSRAILKVRRALGDGYVVTVKGKGYQLVAEVRPAYAERPDTRSRSPIGAVAVGAGLLVVLGTFWLTRSDRRPQVRAPDPATRYVEIPTDDQRALEFYLSARSYEQMASDGDQELVARQYRRAVEQDPGFALAWARLSIAHNEAYWFRRDVSPARRQLAHDAALRALELAPDLPEAHMALGWYHYHLEQDARAAITELERAAEGMPDDGEIHWRLGIVYRRIGEFENALGHFETLAERRPFDSSWLAVAAETYVWVRDYTSAQSVCHRLREVTPNHATALDLDALIPLYREGDVEALRVAVRERPLTIVSPQFAIPRPILAWMAAIFSRDAEAALDALAAWPGEAWRDDRRYLSKDGLRATALELADRATEAVTSWQRALAHVEGALGQNPDYPDAWMARAEALARLGDPSAAVVEAHRVIEYFEKVGDVMSASEHRIDAVRRVFVPAGALDDAFASLDTYLAEPGVWSIEGLAVDPRLDPLRSDPRFADLLARYGRSTASR